MLTFLSALYNEAESLIDLIECVEPFVDAYAIVDDGSIDRTPDILRRLKSSIGDNFHYKTIEHTGLPETVKNEALQFVPDSSWVLMLDADERISSGTLKEIKDWIKNEDESSLIDYVYFRQIEFIDGQAVREFQKCKLFRKEVISFPLDNIHADDQFKGTGFYEETWVVAHSKSSTKQIMRESEYLETYKKLLESGKIDAGRYRWLVGLHHYVKP